MTDLIIVFLGLVVLQGFCSMGHSYLTAWISQRIVADFRQHLFAHLHTLSVSFFARRRTGELLSRLMNDVTVIQSVVTEVPIDSAKQLVTLVGGIAFLLTMNWRLCLLILVLLPLLVLVAKFFGRRLKSLSTSIQDQTAALTYPDRGSDLGHPDREVLRPNTARRDQIFRTSRTDLVVDDAPGRHHGRVCSRHYASSPSPPPPRYCGMEDARSSTEACRRATSLHSSSLPEF